VKPKGPRVKASLPAVYIVGDAGMAHTDVSHGRIVPLLIVDAKNVPSLVEIIRAHQHDQVGEVSTDWGESADKKDTLCLKVEFLRPISCEFAIVFDMPKYACLVDMILASRAAYVQVGAAGDTLVSTVDEPRIILEIQKSEKFAERWEYLFPRIAAKQLRAEKGMSRSDAKEWGTWMVHEWRRVGRFRLPT
jgi:hypothetical protein